MKAKKSNNRRIHTIAKLLHESVDTSSPLKVKIPDIQPAGMTLTEYMKEISKSNPELAELQLPIGGIQQACQTISNLINRAPLTGMLGYQSDGGSINVQGEQQKKLDVLSNEVLKKALKMSGKVGIIASEEEDHPLFNKDAYRVPGGGYRSRKRKVNAHFTNKFVTVFDPLDGSSNVDCNIPVGTIFGMYKEKETMDNCEIDNIDAIEGNCLLNTLQPGTALAAAGYCLYSSSCIFIFTVGAGTHGFTLDTARKEFVLTHPNIQIPKRGRIYSLNEANRWDWDKPLQEYITALQTGENQERAKYSSRYVGSMVGDVHRTLLYGGLYGYPADTNYRDGKLRLLYEAAPMSFLIEQAGGLALTGHTRVMDVRPQHVHQRVPFLAGSYDDIMEMRSFYEV